MTPAQIFPPVLWLMRLLACSFPFATGSLQPFRTHAGWKVLSPVGKVAKILLSLSPSVGKEPVHRT